MPNFVSPSTLRSARGFTIMELITAMFLSMIVVALTLSVALAKKNVLGKDIARTRLAQNLRGALDIVGADVRVAGENLSGAFPAIEIINGASGAPDVLIARRNLLDEVLPLCIALTAGSNAADIHFAIPGTVPGCSYSGQTSSFGAWAAYRTAQGGEIRAYLWDTANKRGEYITITGEVDSGTGYHLVRTSQALSFGYAVGATAIYVLEEWRYEIEDGLLRVIVNQESNNPFNVAFGMSDLQVLALMNDGTEQESFSTSDVWTTIDQLEVSLTGEEMFRGAPITRTLVGRFFPRNVLSN